MIFKTCPSFLLLYMFIHIGCQKREKGVFFFNDFETINGWNETGLIAGGIAHSGNYSNLLDSSNMYGVTFKKSLDQIENKKINKIKVSAWVYVKSIYADGNLVADIQDSSGKSLVWKGFKTRDFVGKTDEWFQITGEINLDKSLLKSDKTKLLIYGWNAGKFPIWLDDIEIILVE